MPKEQFDVWSASGQDLQKWWTWCPENSWRLGSPQDLPDPTILPSGIVPKVDSVVAINSGPLFALILIRVDRANIDQQPCGFVFVSGQIAQLGGTVQHAHYCGRTIVAPPHFMQGIAASGIGLVHPFPGLPTKSVGSFDELDPSFRAGFDKLASYLSGFLSPRTSS
jgi:hypothetical protein